MSLDSLSDCKQQWLLKSPQLYSQAGDTGSPLPMGKHFKFIFWRIGKIVSVLPVPQPSAAIANLPSMVAMFISQGFCLPATEPSLAILGKREIRQKVIKADRMDGRPDG